MIEASEISGAGHVLARAFRDNPGMLAVMRDDPPHVRQRLLDRAMTAYAEAFRRYGRVDVARDPSGTIVATALSFAPRAFPPPFRFQLITGRGFLPGGPRRIVRALRVDSWMKKRHIAEPHWYLNMLGVLPEHQGRGHGTTLMRALNARADADRVPCYLETDKESNIRIYERHGYRVTDRQTAPLGVIVWFMQRALGA